MQHLHVQKHAESDMLQQAIGHKPHHQQILRASIWISRLAIPSFGPPIVGSHAHQLQLLKCQCISRELILLFLRHVWMKHALLHRSCVTQRNGTRCFCLICLGSEMTQQLQSVKCIFEHIFLTARLSCKRDLPSSTYI